MPARVTGPILGLAVAAAGCHLVAGIDALTMRDDLRLVWRMAVTGAGDAEIEAIGVDTEGRAVIAGTHDLPALLGERSLEGAEASNAFVGIVEPDGSVAHLLPLGATERIRPLAAAGTLVAGVYAGDLRSAGAPLASSTNGDALFLVDVDASQGTVTRTRSFGGPAFVLSGDALDVSTDSLGNAILGGGYTGALEFSGCAAYSERTKSNLFLAKLDANRDCVWSIQNIDSAPQRIESVAVDALNDFIVVGGTFVGKLAFAGATPMQNSGGVDLFLARLDGDGVAQWARSFGNGRVQGAARVAAAPGGYSALAGFFEGSVDFGAGPLTATRGHDIIVANFRPDGELAWQRQFKVDREACDPSTCAFDDLDVVFDSEGSLIVTGPFRTALEIDDVTLSTAGDDSATFVAKFDRSGNLLWSGYFGDAGDRCEARGGCRIAMGVGRNRNILVGGSFAEKLDFRSVGNAGGAGNGTLASTGGRDGFLAAFLR